MIVSRNLAAAASESFDLIVVGGGIHGTCLLLLAARHGLKTLLVERNDFGGATSAHSLRILHGGLRYLQTLDLSRFMQSVRERRWFFRHFPDLTAPVACLMPLYGRGLRRPSVFRIALTLNDGISWRRNHGVAAQCQIPGSSVLSREEAARRLPFVVQQGLCGAALWHDGLMLSPSRLIMEILRWSVNCGARALNYVEATGLLKARGRVVGVECMDRVSGDQAEISASVVVNCAGPWCRELAERFDRDMPDLFRASVGFNLLLRRPPLSDHAFAVSPPDQNSTYFLLPCEGNILVGTRHTAWRAPVTRPAADESEIARILTDLNRAMPSVNLTREDVLQVMCGFLPATAEGALLQSKRPVVLHHRDRGGPSGLFSLSGVKYTTARAIAQRTLDAVTSYVGRSLSRQYSDRPETAWSPRDPDCTWHDATDNLSLKGRIQAIARRESVIHLEDLVMRRIDGAWRRDHLTELAAWTAQVLGWSPARQDVELQIARQAFVNPDGTGLAEINPQCIVRSG